MKSKLLVIALVGMFALAGVALADTINGTRHGDSLSGRPATTRSRALAGNDFVAACDGNDTVYAGPGHDVVEAGGGNDTVLGGAGNDIDPRRLRATTCCAGVTATTSSRAARATT